MSQRSERYRFHLEKALETDTPEKKDFHIRQALQLIVVYRMQGECPGVESDNS